MGFGIYDIWAKTDGYLPLVNHMFDVGCVTEELLRNSTLGLVVDNLVLDLELDKEDVISLVSYINAIHDIGKAHPFFQGKDEKTKKLLLENNLWDESYISLRHEYYSAEVINRILYDKGMMDKSVVKTLSSIVSIHHYKVEKMELRKKKLVYPVRVRWEEFQNEIEKEVNKYFNIDNVCINKFERVDAVCMQILGVMVVADWLASGDYYDHTGANLYNLEEYYKWSKLEAKKAIVKAGLSINKVLPKDMKYEDIDENIKMDNLRPIQKELYYELQKNIPELLIVEAPMGEGKTEAAIYASSKMGKGERGVYFALPTSATSNQMFWRLNKVYRNLNLNDVNLVHAMNWLVLDCKEGKTSEISEWLNNTRRGLLSSSAVGTIDQAMLSVMQVKFGVLRLLGLVGKVLIIDEIHSYDAYMTSIIEVLLQWCSALRVPVIMLSATLQKNERENLIKAYSGVYPKDTSMGYPLLTMVNSCGGLKQIDVKDTYINNKVDVDLLYIVDNKDILNKLNILKNRDGCVAVIMNTVKEAQSLYKDVKDEFKDVFDIELILFHAKFKAKRRKELEDLCVNKFGKNAKGKRPKKAILIATQVVEQSLDVDFDWMFTAICPIDLLLQRIGRLHRHQETFRPDWLKTPRITVIMNESGEWGATKSVYAPWILERTEAVLHMSSIEIPKDIRGLIENVYIDNLTDISEEILESWSIYKFQNNIQKKYGEAVAFKSPFADEFSLVNQGYMSLEDATEVDNKFIAKTRFGSPSKQCIFVEEKEIEENNVNLGECLNKDQAKVLLENSLSVPSYNLATEPGEDFIKPIEGKGLLKGNLIYITKDNKYYFSGDGIKLYNIDDEYGFIVERR